ncbi:uncharacterized protein LACBIDRAFT_314001 [Laccaria bicolor S238N-H82]|uniref:Predicted protein n=1 Tax=Laccaria bicolor (strain S238N-H82 / ATCC MYA-4686) TaxID=486041 RepID=B0D1C7_LACBS|nr:uncharacterized protein LACBIDRAFT_314001 [Laccaria bicolor S238N-H82]EDR11977.1 predicted protein [Laccaria bicolor S238N-H82]|eukprot:XP_001877874.1 predicted protein [Laccaria bicolor S238N-H82]
MEPATGSSSNPLSSASTLKPHLLHAYTDPMPSRKSPLENKLLLEVPRALVISGLENASLSTQRSLVRVLAERRIVLEGPNRDTTHKEDDEDECDRKHHAEDYDGTWNLPDGFILIFVCPLNEKDRPAIHKSLLDKFAMSTDIFVPQSIRNALHSLPFSPTHTQSHPHFFSYSNPSSPSPMHPISLPQAQTPPIFTKPLPFSQNNKAPDKLFPNDAIIPASFLDTLRETSRRAHISPMLSLFLSDLFSATRHTSQLDATLLTATAMKDAQDLVRAERVLGTDLTGTELVRPTAKFYDDISEELSELNGLKAGQSRTSDDFSEYVTVNISSASRSTTTSTTSSMSRAPVVLDVSEVDVARIMPRVITHRVKLRDGPEDEVLASAVFGATFGSGSGFDEDGPMGDSESMWTTCPPDSDERQEGRWSGWNEGKSPLPVRKTTTVKEILVDILGEV